MITEEDVLKALEEGKTVRYHCWHFTKEYMGCGDGCCYDPFEPPNAEEAISRMGSYVRDRWNEVRIDND